MSSCHHSAIRFQPSMRKGTAPASSAPTGRQARPTHQTSARTVARRSMTATPTKMRSETAMQMMVMNRLGSMANTLEGGPHCAASARMRIRHRFEFH